MVSSGMEVNTVYHLYFTFYRIRKYFPYDLRFYFSAENSFCILTKKKKPHILSLSYFINTYFKRVLGV